MQIIELIILFIYGTIFGSFFNVLGLRLPQERLFKKSRSYCYHCQHQLTWRELIPILSYLLQRGRCRECQQKISSLYPVMEMMTGFLFAYSYYRFAWTHLFFLALLLISLIIPITISDLVYQKIPNKILLFFTPVFIAYRLLYPIYSFTYLLLSAGFAFIFIYILILLTKGGMGVGDLKYYTLFAFVFGWFDFMFILFLSAIYGGIAGLYHLKINKAHLKTKIAFAPYIGLAVLTLFYFKTFLYQFL